MKLDFISRPLAIAEFITEMTMRRKVWRRIPGHTDRFMDLEHQRRYDAISDTLTVLAVMTAQEWAAIVARIEEKRTAKGTQETLF